MSLYPFRKPHQIQSRESILNQDAQNFQRLPAPPMFAGFEGNQHVTRCLIMGIERDGSRLLNNGDWHPLEACMNG